MGGDGDDSRSPRKLAKEGLDPAEVGTQMAADNLNRLGKQSLTMLAFSAKRDDAVAWKFVFKNKMEDAFGDVAKRLLSGNAPYTAQEWNALEEWQKVYVNESDKAIYGIMLMTVQRGKR